MDLNYAKHMIEDSEYLVCLLGISTSMDCGCLNYRQEDGLYDLEQQYGYAPEEIFSSVFFNTRPRQFFEFYKNELLGKTGEPDICMKTLAMMEADGKLKSIITRELFSMPGRAGCRNVIKLHGSIYDNRCPRCGKHFNMSYMKQASGVPLCTSCHIPVRPGVNLIGDRMNSSKISQASVEISKADTLMILGGHMQTLLVTTMLPYFSGKRILLINQEDHPSDRIADFVYHGKPRDILPLLYPGRMAAMQ